MRYFLLPSALCLTLSACVAHPERASNPSQRDRSQPRPAQEQPVRSEFGGEYLVEEGNSSAHFDSPHEEASFGRKMLGRRETPQPEQKLQLAGVHDEALLEAYVNAEHLHTLSTLNRALHRENYVMVDFTTRATHYFVELAWRERDVMQYGKLIYSLPDNHDVRDVLSAQQLLEDAQAAAIERR